MSENIVLGHRRKAGFFVASPLVKSANIARVLTHAFHTGFECAFFWATDIKFAPWK